MSRAPEPCKITAVLGPTNTGKTHLALERMLARSSGVMGLPLRLLARELYDKVVKLKGASSVALITGEEKIRPPSARYFLCTVEAMPMDMHPAFMAIDEIQLAADSARGHIFTDRLLNARGREETMFMGASTMRPIIRQLVPEADIEERERFSILSYAGSKKLSKLPRRSAVVAFSAENVYSIAELMRRQRGGSAVVMGALSPRTRNAQVELYQSGEVDFLIATDAIGMGLNMDVDHVAFAAHKKFDGSKRRHLYPHELGQIAGRAGRFRNDGTFGDTADTKPLNPGVIERIENHAFEPVKRLIWRNTKLDLSSLDTLRQTLYSSAPKIELERVRHALDEDVLELMIRDDDVLERINSSEAVACLWDVCCTPDFRKTTREEHVRLVKTLFEHITKPKGYLPEPWLEAQLSRLEETTGGVDILAQRLSYVRTWAYAANRPSWTQKPSYWQERTREIEDKLSDALHERLIARFVDKRTSALMKGLREKSDLLASLHSNGDVVVEGHFVGQLTGLQFKADHEGSPLARRAVAHAAFQAIRPEVNRRLDALTLCTNDELELLNTGQINFQEIPIARLKPGSNPFKPSITLIGGELGAHEVLARACRKLEIYVSQLIEHVIQPLVRLRIAIESGQNLGGLARGIGYHLIEHYGSVPRAQLASEIAHLSTLERRQLKAWGIRIGEHSVFMPHLLKPKQAQMLAMLKANADGRHHGAAFIPPAGLTSLPVESCYDEGDYAAAGFQRCGPRAVRLDILERLADLIRSARINDQSKKAFYLNSDMLNLLGVGIDDLRSILKALGYKRLKKINGKSGMASQELWVGRARSLVRVAAARKDQNLHKDTPFSVLADLSLPNERPSQVSRAKDAKLQKRKIKQSMPGPHNSS